MSLRDEGKTVFFTTHYMEEAEMLADKVVIISKGKIRFYSYITCKKSK